MLVITGGVMGQPWTEEDYVRTTRQIERWILKLIGCMRMLAKSIIQVRRIQD
jgi:hypothetical protein